MFGSVNLVPLARAAPPDAGGRWGPYVSVVPPALLAEALKHLDPAHVDGNGVEADRRLSAAVARDTRLVGFWDGMPVNNDMVRKPAPPSASGIDDASTRSVGVEPERARAALAAMDESYLWIQRGRRAYCGWLACNAAFVAEHDRLWAAALPELRRFGIPQMGPAVRATAREAGASVAAAPLNGLLGAFDAFLRRWNLANLSGPRLPYPFADQIPRLGPGPGLQPGHGNRTLATFQVSRTSPPLPGEMLRQAVEDALRDRGGAGDADEHLRPWFDVIAKDNTGRQTLDRYARLFALQHYWRVLHARYGPACHRRQSRLEPVLAQFLGVSVETVHADLQLLRRQLGADWHLTTVPPT